MWNDCATYTNSPKKLLFNIFYRGQEYCFHLDESNTVSDLKKEIHKKFGIAPYKQIIECWYKDPQADSSLLKSCCLTDDCNNLIIHNVENRSTNCATPISKSTSRESSNNAVKGPFRESNDAADCSIDNETKSTQSFVQYFSTNFSSKGITFRIISLKDAVNRVCSSDPAMRQVLILYLHKKDTAFANIFCKQLMNSEVQAVLNKTFLLLCWDLEDDSHNRALVEALWDHVELKNYDYLIESKICAALVIAPLEHSSIIVLSLMKNNITERDFLTTLKQAEEFLITENASNTNSETAFGSEAYQQLMLDMLGDRDYDSFDHYEHTCLKKKIGYALYGPPQKENGYEEHQNKIIENLFKVIIKENNFISKWKDRVVMTVIYVCTEPLPEEKRKRKAKSTDYNSNSDLTPVPVFVLRKCKHSNNPCRVFIDDTRRVYQSWDQYLEDNKLPKCEMIFPKYGRYKGDDAGKVILGRQLSPSCGAAAAVLRTTDIASTVGGIASGGMLVTAALLPATIAAVPAVAVAAPIALLTATVAGVATGIYSVSRSAYSLYDRGAHNESLNFLGSSEARGAYLNIVAGALGFAGAGANIVVSKLVAQGSNIGRGATATVNAVNMVNLGASGVSVANASYDVLRQWVDENETPSMLTIVQLSSSILFFGHAVYNFRTVSSVIEEAQTNVLKEYQDSLRSNRHRKTFNKMMRETIRQNDGNVQTGRAEVISTIKNIQNKDEVFATLTRSNKNMNKNNVRFAAKNGEISMNGVAVDMAKFGGMEKNEVITFLTKLPGRPQPSHADVVNMRSYLQRSFRGINCPEIAHLAVDFVKIFLDTDSTIKEKVINALVKLITFLTGNPDDFMKTLDQIFPSHRKIFELLDMVNGFFQSFVNELEEQYKKWLETKDPQYEKPYFIKLSLDAAKRATDLFKIATKIYFIGTNPTEAGFKLLLKYFYTWFAKQVYMYEQRLERMQKRKAHGGTAARKVTCLVCGGHFHSQ